jgi:hypothetical protein
MNNRSKDPVDRLVAAYEAMLGRVHEAADTAESKTVPWLRDTLANARERAVELEELTREEAERVSKYVERDLHEAASYIAETGQEFRDWASFDWQLMQNRMLELFAGMADQTSDTLRQFAEQAREASVYRTGDITAAGQFGCVDCGGVLKLAKTGHLPPCGKCQGTRFRRMTGEVDAATDPD